MSFKIVQTIDGGKYVLTTVPEAWENKGNLRWPKHNSEILRCDSSSIPEDNWLSTNCIVKRKSILGFEEAENELKAMNAVANIDQEIITKQLQNKLADIETDFYKLARHFFGTQIYKPPTASKIRLDIDQTSQLLVNSNEMMSEKNARMDFEICKNLDVSQEQSNSSEPEVLPLQDEGSENEDVLSPKTENINSDVLITHALEDTCQETGEQQACVGNMENLMATTNNFSTKLTTLETKIDNFIASSTKTQMIISLNQEQIMQKLSEISAKFEGYMKRSSTLHLNQMEDLNRLINIRDEDRLNDFEESLKNNETMDEMVKLYSVVCGKGKGSAINNAYALIDAMFDRHFLNQCSWAGGSRGETSKLCFKSYKRTINLFFKVVHASDNHFTLLECESFLKNILRNAKKRSESKQLKCSAEKKRPKKHKKDET